MAAVLTMSNSDDVMEETVPCAVLPGFRVCWLWRSV